MHDGIFYEPRRQYLFYFVNLNHDIRLYLYNKIKPFTNTHVIPVILKGAQIWRVFRKSIKILRAHPQIRCNFIGLKSQSINWITTYFVQNMS